MDSFVPDRHDRVTMRERIIVLSFLGDAFVVVLALLAAYWLRFATPLVNYGVVELEMSLAEYLPHIVLGSGFMLALLCGFRLYATAYIHAARRHWRLIGQASVCWVLGYLTLTLVLKVNPPISRLYCVMAGSLLLLGLTGWRRALLGWLRGDRVCQRIRQRILFIGWSEESERLLRAIEREPVRIHEVVGIVPEDDREFCLEPPGWIPRLGGYDDVERLLRNHEIDLVLLTDMGLPKEQLVNIALACEREMVEFKLIPNVFQVLVSGLHLENFGGIPLLGVSRLPLHSALNSYLKRAVDVVGGLLGLILGAPLLVFFGAMIKLEDGGPVIYRQRRLGRNGKPFTIFKLRSMRLDAEKPGSVGWTVKGDPRCLRVGGFMRRWNIDEVPQFLNVLRGEMSLVGPRPERPELIDGFKHQILHYNARHNIKPGITGWAQVNGLRGDTDLTERLKADIYYIENWNLWSDVQIMVMTFFKRENAC
jgi:exopolysaccharide biosynthesis polyprenyl glycosylphosphotransferase